KEVDGNSLNGVVEDSISPANGGFVVSKYIVSKTETRPQVVPIMLEEVGVHVGIALKNKSNRGSGIDNRLLARTDGRRFPVELAKSQIGVVPQAQGERQAGGDLYAILAEKPPEGLPVIVFT